MMGLLWGRFDEIFSNTEEDFLKQKDDKTIVLV